MDGGTNGSSTLLPRIARTLRDKQFLAFYAMGLFALSYVPPLVTGWLREHRPLSDLVSDRNQLFEDLWSTRSGSVALVVVVFLGLRACLYTGYLRSLADTPTWRPANGRQFARMLGLLLILELIAWGFSFAFTRLGFNGPEEPTGGVAEAAGAIVIMVQILVLLALLYADFAIVAGDRRLPAALRDSALTTRHNLPISVLVFTFLVFVSWAAARLVAGLDTSAVRMLPTLVIVVVGSGGIAFVCDVVLLSAYLTTRDRLATGTGSDHVR